MKDSEESETLGFTPEMESTKAPVVVGTRTPKTMLVLTEERRPRDRP